MGVGREFEGKDLAEALERAARAMGVESGDLRYEVVEEARAGLFGLWGRRIRIWVRLSEEQAHRHEADVTPPGLELTDTQRRVEETLHRMFHLMGLDLRIRSAGTHDGLRLELSGPDRRLLLGRDGDLLLALQLLLNRMARRAWPAAGRIAVHCDGFRSRRDEELAELAREVAAQVGRTGQARKLHPMNPYERRIVHMTVRDHPGIATVSEGEGFLKAITVEPDPRP